MTFPNPDAIENACKTVLDHLRTSTKGMATNSTLRRLLGGDEGLLQEVREELILNELALDKGGVGLQLASAADLLNSLPATEQHESPSLRLRVFLSYGHDELVSMARRIKADLEARGHEVWFDEERLKVAADWEHAIDEGLDWVAAAGACGRFVLVMTPHSVRRPNGYCLNEIARALSRRLRIVPVMLVLCEPPLSICRIQYLDMTTCLPLEQNVGPYQKSFTRLLRALEENKLDYEGAQQLIKRSLAHFSMDSETAHLLRFTGREWVIEAIDQWLKEETRERIFFLSGPPGVGKSTLSAWIAANRLEISAAHFCHAMDSEKGDPRLAVQSLAYQLATQLPDYQERLLPILAAGEDRDERNTHALFDRLLVAPFQGRYPSPERPVVLLIDAIDEVTRQGRNELAEFLAANFRKLPSWFRLFVTSRPTVETSRIVSDLKPLFGVRQFLLDPQTAQNRADIGRYLEKTVFGKRNDLDHLLRIIERQGEGLFLYADYLREAVAHGQVSMEKPQDFPQGLSGMVRSNFERQFQDPKRFRRLRPLLEALCALRDPLP